MDAPTTHRIEEEETMPTLTGVRAVKLPVKDLPSSVQWYREVFGYRPTVEFPDANGVVVGVAGELPGSTTGLSLRANPEAHSMVGLEVTISVADRDALEPWVEHLDVLGVGHSPIVEASLGWLVAFNDPDGHEFHLYTETRHGIDQSGRPGYGRLVGTAAE
jgi:catechol 2,3-dioxygenase-like lactoylglutathione lyase family enzyme